MRTLVERESLVSRQLGWPALRGEDDALDVQNDANASTTINLTCTRQRAGNRSHKISTRRNKLKSEENALLKYLSLLGLLLTTVVSTSILVGLVKGWKITG